MIKCQMCNRITAPREKSNFFVVEKRPKIYYNTYTRIDRKTKEKEVITQEIGRGYETVKELKICDECFKKVTGGEHD